MDAQELFDAITDSAVLLDKSGRVLNWNAGASALFGYSKKEVLGWSINFIYDRHYPFPKLIQEINGCKKKWQEDTHFIRKNGLRGTCKSYLCSLSPNEQNKMLALLIHHNLTSSKKIEEDLQKENTKRLQQLNQLHHDFWSANAFIIHNMNYLEQIEKKLRESELRFRLLAENATDVISRHSANGNYLYASPASNTSIGYCHEELIGKNIYKLIHRDDFAKIKKVFTRRHEDVSNKPVMYRIKHKEGEFRWFESNVRIILDEQTKIINEIQLASRDVTDRILDKKARLRGQQLAHVFRLSSMEEMASGMAHEISQPLAAVVNFTRGCMRHLENSDYDRDQLRSVMQKAALQAERAGEIIQRLKNFFCKGQLIKTPCKIHSVIRETVSLIKHELIASKTKIDFNFAKEVPFIFIDKIQTQQVLQNLIQNAIEAMQEKHIKDKRIHITTQILEEKVDLTIRDTGPGFPKELIHKVFMPFFTTKAHGRGMGLAICRSIIEAHGGEFIINPNHNKNSWIRFSLPFSIE